MQGEGIQEDGMQVQVHSAGACQWCRTPPGPLNNLLRLRSSIRLLLALLLLPIALTLAVALLPVALLHDAMMSHATAPRTAQSPSGLALNAMPDVCGMARYIMQLCRSDVHGPKETPYSETPYFAEIIWGGRLAR